MIKAVRDMRPATSRSLAVVLVERSMHPEWLSNAFVVADAEGGTALFVDSGADVGPLVAGRERDHNPFVRVWSGAEPEGAERVRVSGRDATLLVWSPDYDGKGKAWVRFDDGSEAIVGGSRVER